MGKGAFTLGLNKAGSEAYLPLPRAEVNSAWNRNYTLPYNFIACKKTRLTFLHSRLKVFCVNIRTVLCVSLQQLSCSQENSATTTTVLPGSVSVMRELLDFFTL
jgi:hypothetical protein